MQITMSDPLIESSFTEQDEFKQYALDHAQRFPHVFKLLPKEADPELIFKKGSAWANYALDGAVNIWIDTSHPEALRFYRENFKQEKEKAMSTALTVQEKSNVKKMLSNSLKAIESVLPKYLPPEKMARLAYTAVTKNPELARCSAASLYNAVLEAAAVGLEIGGPLGFAHMIPFKRKVTLIIDYKGLIELAYKSPKVKAFTAQPVYENDEFSYNYGLHKDIVHRPAQGPKGKLTHGYAIVEYFGGGFDFEVVTHDDAMAAKNNSPAKNKADSPWNVKKHEWTMWVKTAVRKLMKRVPKTPEMQRALNIDENPEAKTDTFIDVDFETVKTMETKDLSGELIENEETETEEPAPTDEPMPEYTEMEKKIMANLKVCKDDSVLGEIYLKCCKVMDIDPDVIHDPKTSNEILNMMRDQS